MPVAHVAAALKTKTTPADDVSGYTYEQKRIFSRNELNYRQQTKQLFSQFLLF